MPAISCTGSRRVPRTLSVARSSWRSSTYKPRYFSSEPPPDRLPFSVHSLGLDRAFLSPPVLASIRHLPEVETAWTSFPSAMEPLTRAVQVFAGMAKGGTEHLAACALLAEGYHRLGRYDDALRVLQELFHLHHSAANTSVQLAYAKVLWTRGDFAKSRQQCDALLVWLQQQEASSRLAVASAMNGKALAQLAALTDPNEMDQVLTSFQDVVDYLEANKDKDGLDEGTHCTLLAAAHAHWGVAEVVCGSLWLQDNDSMGEDATTLEPLETWSRGLHILTQDDDPSSKIHPTPPAALVIQANLHAHLAWGILPEGVPVSDSNERISAASEHASQAIQALDSVGTKEGLCRILAIVASCYHQGGQAVTAEGLFQSAVDRKRLPPGPLSLLELQEALRGYSKLCQNWDKRQADAIRLATQADEINTLLPEAWRGKSGMLHSSLWFWTPADFS